MLKRFILLFTLFGSLSLLGFSAYSYLPEHLGRKMEKHLFKVFGKEVEYQEMALNDSVRFNHQLYTVHRNDTISGYAMISRAMGCQIGGCEKPKREDSLAFEQFYFMTAFNKDKSIKRVRILEYSSNHGYEIANRGWLKQFQKGTSFKVGENIDGISGATISVKSITEGVNKQVGIMRSVD